MKKRHKKYYPNIHKTPRGQKGRPVRRKNKYSVVNIGKTIILTILGLVIVLGIIVRVRHFVLYHILDKPHEKATEKALDKGIGRNSLTPNGES